MTGMFRLTESELKARLERMAKTLPVRKVKLLDAQAPVLGGKAAVREIAKPKEHDEQAAVINWWAAAHKSFGLPEYALYAVPNGANKSMAQAMKFKREGLRKGIPDLNLDCPKSGYSGLRIEMKAGKNKPSAEQSEVISYLNEAGYWADICYSAGEAIDVIKAYLEGWRGNERS